jgi:hypothetical protein
MSRNFIKMICIGFLCHYSSVSAQSTTDTLRIMKEQPELKSPQQNKDKVEAQLYGFIRNDIFYDTRQMIGAGETLVPLYPKDRLLDVNGADINDASRFHMLSIVSRAGLNLKGPELLGAKTSGILEGEFFGATEGGINEFRLRHAYVMLDWEKTQLGIGQYWHPFVVLEALPNVANYGTGAPVYALNRNPQVRLTHKLTDHLKVIAAVHSQRDFTPNNEPFRNSGMPAAHLQLQYKTQNFTAGIAGQYENLKPKISSGTPAIKSNERVQNLSFMAYTKLNTKPLQVTLAGYLMQDASSFVQLGGIVGYQTSPTAVETYKPMNTHSFWMDLQQNSKGKLAVGLFTGYVRNNGVKDPVEGAVATTYGVTTNWGAVSATKGGRTVNYMYKFIPRLDFTLSKALKFRLEYDRSVAQWADATIKGTGTENKYIASNNRFQITTLFNF